MLEGGNVLVVDIHVEEAESPEAPDPENIGVALLKALGLGKQEIVKPKRPKVDPRIVAANEEDADDWLNRTSREALKGMKD
jgi:hypothetical protein